MLASDISQNAGPMMESPKSFKQQGHGAGKVKKLSFSLKEM